MYLTRQYTCDPHELRKYLDRSEHHMADTFNLVRYAYHYVSFLSELLMSDSVNNLM